MKLKLVHHKEVESLVESGVVISEYHYLCPCRNSKVIHVSKIKPEYELIDEDILCSYCREIFSLVPNTKGSSVVKIKSKEIEPQLFPKRRGSGLKNNRNKLLAKENVKNTGEQ